MEVREVQCKSLLNKSGLADYCINCYTGCSHGCRYCYARFMKKYTSHQEPWGEFVDVKVNAPRVLDRELPRKSRGSVFLSSVCDPYQPLESKYGLTGKCLRILLHRQWPVVVQTKSPLVMRDLKVLKGFENATVGFTITTLDEKVRKAFEPETVSSEQRIGALKKLHESGIKTYAFIGPMYPFLTEKDLEGIFERLSEAVDEVYVDKLSIKYGNWSDIEQALEQHYPEYLQRWEKVLFKDSDYYQRLKEKIRTLSDRYDLKVVYCY